MAYDAFDALAHLPEEDAFSATVSAALQTSAVFRMLCFSPKVLNVWPVELPVDNLAIS